MNNEVVFKALRTLGIKINESDYEFQVQSHPDYPSLLSVCDTLSFFNIQNFALKIPKEDIDQLPEMFLTVINKRICTVSKEGNQFLLTFGKTQEKVDRKQLEERWTNFVLLINSTEKPESQQLEAWSRNSHQFIVLVFCTIAVYTIFVRTASLETVLFALTTLLGIYFSVQAFKIQLGINSASSNMICGISTKTDCHAIIGNFEGLFDKIKISDLSVWYFTGQFLSILLLSSSPNFNSSLTLLFSISILSIPVILYSLYYQYRIKRMWCPICLLIIGVLVLQLSLSILSQGLIFNIDIEASLYLLAIFSFIAYCLYKIKPFLVDYKDLVISKIESSRFIRNYEFFKNNLLNSSYQSFEDGFLIDNPEAKVKIVLISNLFCKYCKDVHLMLDRIYKKYPSQICILLRFNFSPSLSQEQRDLYFRLGQIHEQKGDKSFMDALTTWFSGEEINNWFARYGMTNKNEVHELEENLKRVNEENFDRGLNFTPNMFVNGLNYPRIYENTLLEKFIPDLIEDQSLQPGESKVSKKNIRLFAD